MTRTAGNSWLRRTAMIAVAAVVCGLVAAADPATPRLDLGEVPRLPTWVLTTSLGGADLDLALDPSDTVSRPVAYRRALDVPQEFVEAHFFPELDKRFRDRVVLHPATVIFLEDTETAAYHEVAEMAQGGVERAGMQALGDYFLWSTGLEDTIRGWFSGSRAMGKLGDMIGGGGKGGGRSKMHIGVGASHRLPKINLGWTLPGSTRVELNVAAVGEVTVGFSRGRATHSRLFANYTYALDRYRLTWRLSF